MSDQRGSADYRLQAARGLLERFWLQTRADRPLSRAETEVCEA
jgi:xanthine dehydrogenase small subunit